MLSYKIKHFFVEKQKIFATQGIRLKIKMYGFITLIALAPFCLNYSYQDKNTVVFLTGNNGSLVPKSKKQTVYLI